MTLRELIDELTAFVESGTAEDSLVEIEGCDCTAPAEGITAYATYTKEEVDQDLTSSPVYRQVPSGYVILIERGAK